MLHVYVDLPVSIIIQKWILVVSILIFECTAVYERVCNVLCVESCLSKNERKIQYALDLELFN